MSYPKKLLPKKNYRIINPNKMLGREYLLVRHTPDKIILDDLDMVKNIAICSQSSHIIGYSLNLLGIFKTKHSKIEVEKSVREMYSQEWKPEMESSRPKHNEFSILRHRGCFYINFKRIHNYPYSSTHPNTKIKYDFVCKMEHKPTLCNYWHFELHWYDTTGTKIVMEKGKVRGIPKLIFSNMREMLKVFAITGKPKRIKKIPKKIYK